MNIEKLKELYKYYELSKEDVYKHQHFVIITRQGIEKIQSKENMAVNFEVIKCETNFAVVKAFASIQETILTKAGAKVNSQTIETFGSALKGLSFKDGNCNSWYVMEMAEKRALSRAVLKLAGFYELGVFGEDESEDFKRK